MNPSHKAIEQADKTAAAIDTLRKRVDGTTIFASQLQLHSETLTNLKEYLQRTDHTISFIGPVGVGKTTAICRLLNLIQDTKPILDVGMGRTTISEVHVINGHDYGIAIDPLPDAEVRRYVDELADYLLALARTDNGQAPHSSDTRELILGAEMERCLRNMCDLQKKSKKTDGRVIIEDKALDLARQIIDQDVLRAEIWTRMNIPMRKKTELICEESNDENKKKWLKKNFSAINHGRNPEFGIPSRITVIVPYALIDHPEYDVTVVDTKGIDQTSQRTDIEKQLKDARNLNIFCSSFPDAPDEATVSIIRRAIESGIGGRLATETCLLVLPHNDEAVNVNGPDGQPVGDKELGYEMKRGEIIPTVMILGLRDYAIYFHDDRNDPADALQHFVNNRIDALRSYYEKRISDVAKTVSDLESNIENAIGRAAFRHVINALQAWVKECREGIAAVKTVHKTLVEFIGDSKTHASSVRASVSRRGHWYNMDFYYQIGFESRYQSVVSTRALTQNFSAITNNMILRNDLLPAHSFVRELQHYITSSSENLYNEMQQIGLGIFEQPMEQSADWDKMSLEWGRGPGYKSRIVKHTEEWFIAKQQEIRLNLFRNRLRDAWLKLLIDFEKKLEGAIPE